MANYRPAEDEILRDLRGGGFYMKTNLGILDDRIGVFDADVGQSL